MEWLQGLAEHVEQCGGHADESLAGWSVVLKPLTNGKEWVTYINQDGSRRFRSKREVRRSEGIACSLAHPSAPSPSDV